MSDDVVDSTLITLALFSTVIAVMLLLIVAATVEDTLKNNLLLMTVGFCTGGSGYCLWRGFDDLE